MANSQGTGYREHLAAELQRRQTVNPRYSLRAFASGIGLSPAYLSKILKGQRHLSVDCAYSIASRLGMSDGEKAHFCGLVENEKRGVIVGEILKTGDENLPREDWVIELETFRVVSDWYHFALRELTETRDFRPEPKWIAARLGIKPEEARGALDRMLTLGMLTWQGGRLVKAHRFISTPTDVPSRAIRNQHAQLIEKAKRSIEEQPVDLRDISGVTIPISLDKMAAAKAEIRKFRRRMVKLLDSSRCEEVYQLNVQFFRLTREMPAKPGRDKK